MFIDYNEIKKFFEKLNNYYENNNIIDMINEVSNWKYLDKLLSVVNISKSIKNSQNIYELSIADYKIGNIISDLNYDTRSDKNKLRLLKFLIKYYEDTRLLFLRSILDINIKLLKDNIDYDIKVKTTVNPKDSKKDYLSDDMYIVDSYIYHMIYADDTLIGMDIKQGIGYKTETDFTNQKNVFEKDYPLDMNTKIYFIKNMILYNQSYFDTLTLKVNKKTR